MPFTKPLPNSNLRSSFPAVPVFNALAAHSSSCWPVLFVWPRSVRLPGGPPCWNGSPNENVPWASSARLWPLQLGTSHRSCFVRWKAVGPPSPTSLSPLFVAGTQRHPATCWWKSLPTLLTCPYPEGGEVDLLIVSDSSLALVPDPNAGSSGTQDERPGMNSSNRTWTSRDAKGRTARAKEAEIVRREKARKAMARARTRGRASMAKVHREVWPTTRTLWARGAGTRLSLHLVLG